MERAKVNGANLPVKEQRIIVSRLAYHIHNVIFDEVKDASTEYSSDDVSRGSIKLNFYNSKNSLLHYGLHLSDQEVDATLNELRILASLKATGDGSDKIPSAIHHF